MKFRRLVAAMAAVVSVVVVGVAVGAGEAAAGDGTIIVED